MTKHVQVTEHVQADLEDPYKFRVAAEIADLLSFYAIRRPGADDLRRAHVENCWSENRTRSAPHTNQVETWRA
jgi:hypothetical protein